MIDKKQVTALFDLDGVILDTESQYDIFWSEQGRKYLPHIKDFHKSIKGQTLPNILKNNFPVHMHSSITDDLNIFERDMPYIFIPGAKEFLISLRKQGVKTAVVTSSNDLKMSNVYREQPDLKSLFDVFVTANKVTRSKPDPQCFLLAANELGSDPSKCVVFEDSFHGLEAGRRAEMIVVGLATTNPREAIKNLADMVIDNFEGFSLDMLS